jgi:alpha-galactosidase
VWQAEISHRYMLGVYELQQRITSAFPHVLLENCASGGKFRDGVVRLGSLLLVHECMTRNGPV